jgi:hypothetical protein
MGQHPEPHLAALIHSPISCCVIVSFCLQLDDLHVTLACNPADRRTFRLEYLPRVLQIQLPTPI